MADKRTMNEEELKKILTPEQYRIMRRNGTEAPFINAYWNNKRPGLYVDPITGEPLFASVDKFDSKTGWPSFLRPIREENIVKKTDKSLGAVRTEVRSKSSDSHLGHVFDDGPAPAGLRYCINSASLRFVPLEDLEKEGYGAFRGLFKKTQSAAFAAGCFWGVESAFRGLPGVVNTTVGYMGGTLKNPTYEDVCTDKTGHAETVLVEYDPSEVSYERLLEHFWDIHDPTTMNRQGPDAGTQYRSAVFFYNPQQEAQARGVKERLQKAGKFKEPIVTQIAPAAEFYRAKDYHQRYYEKRGIKPACHFE